ncbi:hypothetical protein [Phenylobacterium sp.]|uniref:hypothetical protein n=1 Tax=Phenylobacterium sp. TaxID=1871053 RepID=UPI0035B0E6FD
MKDRHTGGGLGASAAASLGLNGLEPNDATLAGFRPHYGHGKHSCGAWLFREDAAAFMSGDDFAHHVLASDQV